MEYSRVTGCKTLSQEMSLGFASIAARIQAIGTLVSPSVQSLYDDLLDTANITSCR